MDTVLGSAIRTDTLGGGRRLNRSRAAENGRLLGYRVVEIRRAIISLERAGVMGTARWSTAR